MRAFQALVGRVVLEVAALEHVARVGVGGVAQRDAGGEVAEPVLGADLVQQDQHLLLVAGALGVLAGGLADGRDE